MAIVAFWLFSTGLIVVGVALVLPFSTIVWFVQRRKARRAVPLVLLALVLSDCADHWMKPSLTDADWEAAIVKDHWKNLTKESVAGAVRQATML